jgi:hypothetical protein
LDAPDGVSYSVIIASTYRTDWLIEVTIVTETRQQILAVDQQFLRSS